MDRYMHLPKHLLFQLSFLSEQAQPYMGLLQCWVLPTDSWRNLLRRMLDFLRFDVENLAENGLPAMLTARPGNMGYVNFVGSVRSQN